MAPKNKTPSKAPGKVLVGREEARAQIAAALGAGRNVLLEGPVGVGKTYLVSQVLRSLGRDVERVDGDTRYTEQKLCGWFDPPVVLKKGYLPDAFVPGPLVAAMREGRVLFVNELNRMPEAVQNVLLPAMDERRVVLPKVGVCHAADGFAVVATQNPAEFTATHSLSEALLDRFEMIRLGYQNRDEEIEIVETALKKSPGRAVVERAVDLVRATREHAAIRRGASVRAAIAMADLTAHGLSFPVAAAMALVPRIEMLSPEERVEELLAGLLEQGRFTAASEKKKN